MNIKNLIIILCGLAIIFAQNCKRDDKISLPVLTTRMISEITQTNAISGGTITSDGGSSIIVRGVCWDTNQSPTVANYKTTDSTGTGSFKSNIAGLRANTTYYVRAYATNSIGTSYGQEQNFTTSASLIPSITTNVVGAITDSSVTCGGNISSDGGATIIASGLCWGKNQLPTVADNKTIGKTISGSFTSLINGLQAYTTYYIRAYATNSVGTAYGIQQTFKTWTVETITDSDGNKYNTVTIGTQIWMVENLRTTKYNDGTAIPYVTNDAIWAALTTPAYCWYNNNVTYNQSAYGAIYNWYTVNTGKLSPIGWHVPTDAEWKTLTDYLVNNGYAFTGTTKGITKSMAAKSDWKSSSTLGAPGNDLSSNNSSGFSALPAGFRTTNGIFGNMYTDGMWWNSSELNSSTGCARDIWHGSYDVGRFDNVKNVGLSVRCIKD